MNTHKNARLTPRGRALLVDRVLVQGLRAQEAAQAAGVDVRTVYKWLKRYREEGRPGLEDRSSRPKRCPHQSSESVRQRIIELRHQRQSYDQISQAVDVSPTTVSRILAQEGLNRLSALEPAPPVKRYEYSEPGGLLHLDIKRLARFWKPGHRVTGDRRLSHSRNAGWEYVHVGVDDHSRVAFSAVYPNEQAASACVFLLQALRYYASLGIRVHRVMTDNGPCYQSRPFKRLCRRLRLTHLRTRPYTPRTNGKAERFIQTALREWAYARAYKSSDQREHHLPYWLHQYNWHRPHASLAYQPPISRVPVVNNLLALHS